MGVEGCRGCDGEEDLVEEREEVDFDDGGAGEAEDVVGVAAADADVDAEAAADEGVSELEGVLNSTGRTCRAGHNAN